MAVLPLFPLGTVLVPGAVLPLQIFEPRYVALITDLFAAQDERPPVFGVVAIRRGFEVGEQGVRTLHPVGCSAQVRQAADLGGRRYLVISEGRTRFRLGPILTDADTLYTQAEVEWLAEVGSDLPQSLALASRLHEEVAAYRRRCGQDEVPVPDSPEETSYWLPQVMDVDLGEAQMLLASDRTDSRLRLALSIVRRERGLTSTLGALGLPQAMGRISPN